MSSQTLGLDIDVTSVADGSDPRFPHGAELRALTDALTGRTTEEPAAERDALVVVAGAPMAERAVAVCATFQMMNRLLDGVGAPVHPSLHPLAAELGFDPAELGR